MEKKKQGFATFDHTRLKEIASKGGKAVSQNKQHMAEIGRKGGERSGESRTKQKEKRDGLSQ